jgi:hypothetical protein
MSIEGPAIKSSINSVSSAGTLNGGGLTNQAGSGDLGLLGQGGSNLSGEGSGLHNEASIVLIQDPARSGSWGRNGPTWRPTNDPKTLVSRGSNVPVSLPIFSENHLNRSLSNLQFPLLSPNGPTSRFPGSAVGPVAPAAGGMTPPSNVSSGPAKAESKAPQRTTAPTTTAAQVQAVKNMLAQRMADDMTESPQKAINKGAVDPQGKVTPNKLEPAVQKELQGLIKDFREHSEGFSKTINDLEKRIKESDNEPFKTAYNDFKDKYNNNFGEGKDLFNEGFNAKDVVESFDKAFEASKGTAYEQDMQEIKDNIIDKYIRPMDNLARGDQGTAFVGRDKLLDSASKSVAGLKNQKLSTAFDKFKKTIDEKGDVKQAAKDLKEQISDLKKDSNLSLEQKAELDKIDKATSTAGQMHQIAFAGVKDNNGKAELDTSKLDFDHKQTSKDFFDYMHQNHREDIKPTLERMNEQSKELSQQDREKAGTNIEFTPKDIETLETSDEKIGSETDPIDQKTIIQESESTFPDDEKEIPDPEEPEPEIDLDD